MLQPSSLSVYEVFSLDRTYRAPLYQRAYVWNAIDHWAPLWADILNAAEWQQSNKEYLDDHEGHFLGAIVVQQDSVAANEVQSLSIIDGQQRLTTLQIILCALRSLAASMHEEEVQKILKDLVVNPERGKAETLWKVQPTNVDRQAFSDVVRGEVSDASGTGIPGAYRFFRKACLDFCVGDQDRGSAGDRLALLSYCLRDRFRAVIIMLSANDDPHMIFEALNARGTPLLASDLIKNFVFSSVATMHMNSDLVYTKYWSYFSESPKGQPENFWIQTVRIGRFDVARLDHYIILYLTVQLAREVTYSRLYAEFKIWWSQDCTREGIERRLTSLREHAKAFVDLISPVDARHVGLAGDWLWQIGITAPLPLLLLAMVSPDSKLSRNEERNGFLQDIESFIVRRAVCGLPSSGYNRFFLELLQDFKKDGVVSRHWLHERLTATYLPARRWPDDSEFSTNWLNAPVYTEMKSRTVRHILFRINQHMLNAKSERASIGVQDLEVEHLLPQKWSEIDYPLPTFQDKDAGHRYEEVRKRLIQSFGNLTLVTSRLNKDISNGPFVLKSERIAEQSLLRLNVYFQRIGTAWGHQEIEKRGKVLFESASRIWSHPGGGPTLADVRNTLFLPRSAVIGVVQLVERARLHRVTLSEVQRTAGDHQMTDLRRLGLFQADGTIGIPEGLERLSAEECIAELASRQETISFAKSILDHNPKLLGTDLGNDIAVRYGIRWTYGSKRKYGGHLITWVRWIDRVKAAADAISTGSGFKTLLDNPEFWTSGIVVTAGRRAALTDRGWYAAAAIWNDLDITEQEAVCRIGLSIPSIRRHLARLGVPSLRDEARRKLAEQKAPKSGPRKARAARKTWNKNVSSKELEDELERMWHDPRYTGKEVAKKAGFSPATLYLKFGARPKKNSKQSELSLRPKAGNST